MITVTVDPFRFAAALPTDTVESGSYTGNAGTDRTITLTFTPKFVVLINETLNIMYFSNISPGTRGFFLASAATPSQQAANDRRPAVTTNGFIVSGSSSQRTNQSATVFHYFAFG